MDDLNDPDWDDVREDLGALHGERVTIMGRDTDTGEHSADDGVLVVVPGLWGHLRRRDEGFFDCR